MARVTIGGGSAQIIKPTKRIVEVSRGVGEAWRAVDYLDCIRATESVLPSIQEAELVYDYGKIKREDRSSFATARPQSIVGNMVRVRTRYGGGPWVVRWCGVIPRESLQVLGKAPALSGKQVFSALGVEHFLAREGVQSSWWLSGGVVVEAMAPAAFNQTGAGGKLVGNRSTAVYTSASGATSYVFSQADGETWTARQILDYLLAWHVSALAPVINLTGQLGTLDSLEPTLALTGATVLGIVAQLIDRRRGLNARIVWTGGEGAELRVATETTVKIRAGDVTLPPNRRIVDLDLASGALRQSAAVITNQEDQVGEIVIRGAPFRTTFSVSYSEDSLEAGWESTNATNYNAAASTLPGFSSADAATKKQAADTVRQTNHFLQAVYRKFRIPSAFAWEFPARALLDPYTDLTTGVATPNTFLQVVPAFKVLPAWTAGGSLDSETLQPAPDRIVRLCPQTSLLRGWNYFTEPAVYTGGSNDRAEVEPPSVYMLGRSTLTAGSVTTFYDFSRGGGDSAWPTGNVSVADDELAIKLDISPIAHSVALNQYDGTTDSPSAFDPVVDWREMIATVAVEGEPVQMRAAIPGAPGGKRLVIDIPEAAVWWIAPGTVVAIGDDGIPQRIWQTNGVLTRDDRGWMRAVLALAQGWYARPRAGISATVLGIGGGAPEPGTMIRRVDAATGQGVESNSLVTMRVYDFTSNKTQFTADYSELDLAGMVRQGIKGPLGSAGGAGGVGARGGGRPDGIPVRFSAGGRGAAAAAAIEDPVPMVVAVLLANGE